MQRLLLCNARLLDPEADSSSTPASLLLEGDRIVERVRAGQDEPRDAQRVDLRGQWLAPGFIDVHHHGRLVFAGERELAAALRHDSEQLARRGVTAFLATTIALPPRILAREVTQLASILTQTRFRGAAPLGIHLEGPWIERRAAGAQPAAAIRDFDPREGCDALDRSEGLVRMVTLAPEVAGVERLLAELDRRGIVAALGHSTADAETARDAIERGARHATHLFNAMGPFHHRRPGLAGVVLADERVSCDLICDGVHVDPAVVRIAARAKGETLLLISDRIDPPSPAPREGFFGAAELRDDGSAYRLPSGRLAGSRLALDLGLRNLLEFAGASLRDAAASCTLRPARLLGQESLRGTLRPGSRADLVILDDAQRVMETWIGGRPAWTRDDAAASYRPGELADLG